MKINTTSAIINRVLNTSHAKPAKAIKIDIRRIDMSRFGCSTIYSMVIKNNRRSSVETWTIEVFEDGKNKSTDKLGICNSGRDTIRISEKLKNSLTLQQFVYLVARNYFIMTSDIIPWFDIDRLTPGMLSNIDVEVYADVSAQIVTGIPGNVARDAVAALHNFRYPITVNNTLTGFTATGRKVDVALSMARLRKIFNISAKCILEMAKDDFWGVAITNTEFLDDEIPHFGAVEIVTTLPEDDKPLWRYVPVPISEILGKKISEETPHDLDIEKAVNCFDDIRLFND